MISLPRGDIRIGLPKKTKRAKRKAEKQRNEAAWHNHISISQGCHPRQVQRYRQFIRDMGISGVEVRETDGAIKFDSRRAMKDWCKATGQCNIDET